MKKVLFILVIVALLTISLTACNLIPDKDADVYNTLNEMASKEYTNINLAVETSYQGVTLLNTYTIMNSSNSTMVTYKTQSLATIGTDEDGNFVVPEDMIVTKEGNAVIKGGQVVEQSGSPADVPVKSISTLKLDFNEAYFNNPYGYAENEQQIFVADVINAKAFTSNAEFDGKDMTVEVRYGEQLEKVTINYTSQKGALVKVTYTFK
ncbi:MAG: hypothetical protein IKL86_05260 [Clostridia bacterium]|nr:hypothetical protein [Clostridia bacterium]